MDDNTRFSFSSVSLISSCPKLGKDQWCVAEGPFPQPVAYLLS